MAVQVTLSKSSTVQYMSIIHCALDLIKENNHKKKQQQTNTKNPNVKIFRCHD